MRIQFSKYQGTGNDFVMLDNTKGVYTHLSIAQIQRICDRRFGVGADGLIKINTSNKGEFEVDYFNADGSKSFCGNGARCSVAFAKQLGLITDTTDFDAIDGMHSAVIKNELIYLDMTDVVGVEKIDQDFIINTGSPHYIRFVEDINEIDIVGLGKEIRYSDRFKKEGINVNIVQIIDDKTIHIATYERGVEDETLSCGTGATACSIAFRILQNQIGTHVHSVKVKGGNLQIGSFSNDNELFTNIQLIGPGQFVYQGEIHVND